MSLNEPATMFSIELIVAVYQCLAFRGN